MAKKVVSQEKFVEKLTAIVAENLGIDEEAVTLDASLVDDLGADSLDVVEIVMELEEEFGIEIDDDKASSWTHVRDVVDGLKDEAWQ